jgi:hypothetical protein
MIGYAKAHTDFNALNDADNMFRYSIQSRESQLQEWEYQISQDDAANEAPFDEKAVHQFYAGWVNAKVFAREVESHIQRLFDHYGEDNQDVLALTTVYTYTQKFDDVIKDLDPEDPASSSKLSEAHMTLENETGTLLPEWERLSADIPVSMID